jgi:hypothetical protein
MRGALPVGKQERLLSALYDSAHEKMARKSLSEPFMPIVC